MILGDKLYIIIQLLLSVAGIFMAVYAANNLNTRWRLFYITPFVLGLYAIGAHSFEASLMGAYIGSVAMLLGFLDERKSSRMKVSVLALILTLVSIPCCMLNKAYRTPDYLKDFEKAFYLMKENYCLTEHKDIDWDELYDKYYPSFKEINKEHDEVEACITWMRFCSEFYDGHVSYMTGTDVIKKASDTMYGNDYGLSLMRLSDGKVVAINVENDSQAANCGISNGTQIISWDGEAVNAMIDSFDQPYLVGIPVLENEEFVKPIYASGKGGDTITVTFVTEDGKTQEACLDKLGYYTGRLEETLFKISEGRNESNLTVTNLNEDTACLRLSQMMYDSDAADSGDYSAMYEELKGKLDEQKQLGVKNLIIDIRDNGGGDPNFILQILKLLAPEEEFGYAYSGVWDYEKNEFLYDEEEGHYVVGEGTTFEGENMWGDGKIILLVSMNTVSAGDHFTALMSKLDNVTIMGFTSTNCSGQAIRGVTLTNGALSFSSVPTLNQDGSIFIDTDTDRVATTPLDIKIPFDEVAVCELFDKDKDYILDYALDYIK